MPVTFVVSAGPNTVPTYSLLTQFGDFGSGYSGDGQFNAPYSLAIDPRTGNILAGDLTGRIQIFDRNGNFKAYFGGNGVQFVSPTVPGTSQVATFYPAGAGGGLFSWGGFPIALAVDPINGNVVALDSGNRVLDLQFRRGVPKHVWITGNKARDSSLSTWVQTTVRWRGDRSGH